VLLEATLAQLNVTYRTFFDCIPRVTWVVLTFRFYATARESGRGISPVPNENSVPCIADVIAQAKPEISSVRGNGLSQVNDISRCARAQGRQFGRRCRRAIEVARGEVDSGSLRRPVVHSGGAVHRPGTRPRLTPFPEAEWIVAGASPFPTRDAFLIGGSSRNTNRGFDAAKFHGTRSHDRGTPAEWNQSHAALCQGERGMERTSRMPMSRTCPLNSLPKIASRSRSR
jgi:hypothetical protein